MKRAHAGGQAAGRKARLGDRVVVRQVRRADLPRIVEIDATVTRLPKPDYWHALHRRYGGMQDAARRFLVAEVDRCVVGFVIGEIRDWEFGSPPCGWVFAISVDPAFRLGGVGSLLLAAISADFRREGVTKLRTMLARDNTLILSFFRSHGMTTGSLLPLEMDLPAEAAPGDAS